MDGSRFCPQHWPGQVLSLRDVLSLPSYPFFSSASVLLYIIKKKPRSRSRYELQIGQCVSNARASSRGSTAGNAYLARERERRRGRGDWTVGIRQSRVGRVGRGKSTTTIHQIVTSGEICNSEFLYSSSSFFIRIVESHPLSLSFLNNFVA